MTTPEPDEANTIPFAAAHAALCADLARSLPLAEGLAAVVGAGFAPQAGEPGHRSHADLVHDIADILDLPSGVDDILRVESGYTALLDDVSASLDLAAGLSTILNPLAPSPAETKRLVAPAPVRQARQGRRKALLIGAERNGLISARNDVDAMARVLARREFQIERLVTPDATRAAVLDAYARLISDARSEDAVVIYYSGAGGGVRTPEGREFQFIVPDDYDESTDEDFRGITNVELSVLLARLTELTPNTTVIFDCCHAAHMSRGPGLRVKALLRPARWNRISAVVQRHVDRLESVGRLPVRQLQLSGNLSAVRVLACSLSESAFSATNRDGVEMGLFTDALTRALRDAEGLRVNWATLIQAVRREVQDLAPAQRPEVEGPSRRQPFEMTELDSLDTLPVVVVAPDRVELPCAPLLGIEVGDEFVIMQASATGPQDGPVFGTATVDRLLPLSAQAQVRLETVGMTLPADARARRIRTAPPALAVRLPKDHPSTEQLADAMSLRPLIRPADDTDAQATVEIAVDTQGGLVVRDDLGPLHAPHPPTPRGITSIMDNLQRIAQATALRRLADDPVRPLEHDVQIEWGRVSNGREEPLPHTGAMLFADAEERVYIRLHNASDQAMFVSLIDIGVSSRITVLTEYAPGGLRLAPNASYTFGWDDYQQRLTGIEITWPEGFPAMAERPEMVLALISDQPLDVSSLLQQGARNGAGWRVDASPLEKLLTRIATGASREVYGTSVGRLRYAVESIDFMVSPTPPPTPERAQFLIDDRPQQPVRLLSLPGTAPLRVDVRINELIVHANQALTSADIRVDALVLTGGGRERPVYRAETMRFSNVRDGERLPLDNVLIYHGAATDFLDIAIWISRDTDRAPALSALLEKSLTSTAVQNAAVQMGGVALAVPQTAVALAGAGAILLNTAYQLLTDVVGRSVGLYRTSLLTQERFGIGRHERHGRDFTFRLSIAPA